VPRKPLIAVAVLALAALLLACGNDGDDKIAGPETTNGSGRPDAADVDRFLMRKGEEPGFRPDGGASTVVGVDTFANGPELSRADAQQLRENGFISFTTRRTLAGGDVAAGASEVLLFASPEGARNWMTHELRARTIHARVPKSKIRRFTVRGVPGARGWTGRDLHGNPIGTAQWVQGRCNLVLASEGEVSFVEVLSTGARAIYERTRGDCP
jgi:hypothetical protein